MIAQNNEVVINDPLPEEVINVREKEGWLQRAFILSFYYLLRYEEYRKI
jgi:hypothetical protein